MVCSECGGDCDNILGSCKELLEEDKCFFCDKIKKGRFLPMDKRESGDNGFGYTFACYECVPERYTRL